MKVVQRQALECVTLADGRVDWAVAVLSLWWNGGKSGLHWAGCQV